MNIPSKSEWTYDMPQIQYSADGDENDDISCDDLSGDLNASRLQVELKDVSEEDEDEDDEL